MKRVFSSSLILLFIALDQLSKWWATKALVYGVPLKVWSFFNLTLSHNTGAAFSFLANQGGWQLIFLSAISLTVSIVLYIWLWRLPCSNRLGQWALVLLIAGAMGNLIDRVRLRYVVDFIQLHYHDWYFANFNVADSLISIGVCLLIVMLVFEKSNA